MKLAQRDNQKFNTAIIIAIILSMVAMIAYVSYLGEDKLKKVANLQIVNVLTIECIFDDDTSSKGTGVIYDDGKILSVAHLFVEDKDIVSIVGKKHNSDKEYMLDIEKIDYDNDLCVLSNSELNASVEVISTSLQYGDKILKIGNSLGYGISIDYGIISNPLKSISFDGNIRELTQISMQIYGGDSGAPIFNENGKLVGIVSFKTSSSISSKAELSFAVSYKTINEFIK